jgi:hypothetical protein
MIPPPKKTKGAKFLRRVTIDSPNRKKRSYQACRRKDLFLHFSRFRKCPTLRRNTRIDPPQGRNGSYFR